MLDYHSAPQVTNVSCYDQVLRIIVLETRFYVSNPVGVNSIGFSIRKKILRFWENNLVPEEFVKSTDFTVRISFIFPEVLHVFLIGKLLYYCKSSFLFTSSNSIEIGMRDRIHGTFMANLSESFSPFLGKAAP